MSVAKVQTPKKGEKKSEDKLSIKSKTPMKKKKQQLKNSAVDAIKDATSTQEKELATNTEEQRKKVQDARTLYIRFSDKFPLTVEHIKELHPDIKFVRAPRLATKKGGKDGIRFAFVEFSDEETCKSAKTKLAATEYKGKELFVDFVGDKSKQKKSSGVQDLNPTRLFIVGLAPGVTRSNLKEMFPKAAHADIPQKSRRKGTSFGFVQFASAADAKAAFDAGQDLSVNGHKITVLYAKATDSKKDVQKKKAEKRKAKKTEKEASGEKKIKIVQESEENDEAESEDDDDAEDNLEDTVEENKEDDKDDDEEDEENLEDTVEENKDADEEDDNDDDDDESDAEDQKESLVLGEAEEADDDEESDNEDADDDDNDDDDED